MDCSFKSSFYQPRRIWNYLVQASERVEERNRSFAEGEMLVFSAVVIGEVDIANTLSEDSDPFENGRLCEAVDVPDIHVHVHYGTVYCVNQVRQKQKVQIKHVLNVDGDDRAFVVEIVLPKGCASSDPYVRRRCVRRVSMMKDEVLCAKGDCYLVAEIVPVSSGVSNKRTKASRRQIHETSVRRSHGDGRFS